MNGELVVSAVRAATHGAEAAAKRSLTIAEVSMLDTLVADLPAARQLAIGRGLLEDPRVGLTPAVRGPLAAILSGLAPVQADDVGHAILLENVRKWARQEIDRIDGKMPSGGLDGHPDYAVVGPIRSDLNLLEGLGVI